MTLYVKYSIRVDKYSAENATELSAGGRAKGEGGRGRRPSYITVYGIIIITLFYV